MFDANSALRSTDRARSIALALLLCLYTAATHSQDPAPKDSTPKELAAPPQAEKAPPNPPAVIDAYRLGHEDWKDKDRAKAGLEDKLIVSVKDLDRLVRASRCLDPQGKKVPDCHEDEIVLFLDKRKMSGITPEAIDLEAGKGFLQFHLRRTPDNDETWADLLGAPPIGSRFFERPTAVSVGLAGADAIATNVTTKDFRLIRIREWRFWICTVVGIGTLIFVWVLARRSTLLRDSGPSPQYGLKPYSLARCQMAFWFVLVIASFLYIWQITGSYDTITTSILGLVGIGAGTALGAAVIDSGKRDTASSELTALHAEAATVTAEVADLDTKLNANPAPANAAELAQTRSIKARRLYEIGVKTSMFAALSAPKQSKAFLDDVLTDADGISFHRFQMLVWTVVLGLVFAYSVWSRLSMPEFSATLLALLGISSGTYIGFKIPEKQS